MALGSDAAAPRAVGEPGAAGGGGPPPAQAPEELIEIQLRSILEATQTSAGAVCLFDQHQELLRLAVEVGLSDEGCRRLRSVRRGAATTWDMPLHSLLNRRVYLIESAAKNRYVPPLVEDVALVRAVACIPLYDGSTPVGSLILVALAPRTFGERQIRLLEQPVRDLVGSIGAMRKRVTSAVPQRATRPSLSASAASPPVGAQLAGPTTPTLKTVPGGAGSGPSIQAAVDRARAELVRLRARLGEAEETAATERSRAESLAAHQRELQARASELVAERERLTETLAARTHDVEVLEDRATSLEADLGKARTAETALRAELDQTRETTAAGAVAASQDTATVEAVRLRATELDAANELLRQRVGELERAEIAARAEAERQLASAVAEAEARGAVLAADVEARLATLTAERDGLRAEVATLHADHAGTLDDAAAQHASTVAALETRATTAEQAVTEWQRRCETLEAELATTQATIGSHSEQAEALERERAHWAAELDAAREREATLLRRVEAAERDLDRTRSEGSQLRNGFAHLESLLQTGVESGDAPTGAGSTDLGGSTFEVVELDDTSVGADDGTSGGFEVEAMVIEEVSAPAPAAEAPASAPAPSAGPAEGLLVIDTETFWSELAPSGATVTAVTPAAGAEGRNPAQLLLNLAAPDALVGFADLRRAGITAPCVAYIGIPGERRGVLVGRFELAARPIDPDALLTTLRGTFARGTRVVTAGADVDGLISLRQALARLGVSVSMAWDVKQAGDLLGMVRPDVAIIDLELPPKDGCALVARLALTQPAPLTVVIPKATDTASTFAAAVAHAELKRVTLPAKELLARVLTLAATPAPATTRR